MVKLGVNTVLFKPFTVIEAMKEVRYAGDITLEAIRFAEKMPKELMPAAAKFMAEVAAYFKKRDE